MDEHPSFCPPQKLVANRPAAAEAARYAPYIIFRVSDTSSHPARESKPRKKAWAPRVKTGCVTCRYVHQPPAPDNSGELTEIARLRRLKCDEGRPDCKQCLVAHRECGGYSSPPSRAVMTVPAALALTTPGTDGATSTEVMLNDYLLSIWNSGVDEYNNEFWKLVMPRCAQHLPAIWQASSALAAVRWSLKECSGVEKQHMAKNFKGLCLQQYSKSITQILDLTKRPSLSVLDKCYILLANLMYGFCSNELGYQGEFLDVVMHALRLIRHWKLWRHICSHTESSIVAQTVLQTLELQRVITDVQIYTGQKVLWQWRDAISDLQGYPMKSMLQASIETEMLWGSLHAVLDELPFRPTEQQIKSALATRTLLQQQSDSWDERYCEFSQLQRLPDADLPGSPALEVRGLLINILLKVQLVGGGMYRDETAWDEFDNDFARIVSLSEKMTHQSDINLPQGQSRFFSFTKSLLFVTKACREPSTRRRACRVLLVAIQKGLLATGQKSNALAASPDGPVFAIINNMIALEEGASGTCQEAAGCVPGRFVCGMHRIASVRFTAQSRELALLTTQSLLNNEPVRSLSAADMIWS